MGRIIRHTLLLAAITFTAMAWQSCVFDHYGEEPVQTPKEGETVMIFRIGILNLSNTSAPTDNELINTLRLVITDNGAVEYNEKIYDGAPADMLEIMTKITTGQKKIFLIANAESLPLYAPDATDGETFFASYPRHSIGFAEAVNSAWFPADYFEETMPLIPLTAEYDVYVQPGEEQDFWLVPAATKYTVHIENNRTSTVTLNDLSISSLETRMYLMAHVGDTQYTMSGQYWIDWLRDVSDQSHQGNNATEPGNSAFNTLKGWIKDYTVPFGSQKFTFSPVKGQEIDIDGAQTVSGQAPIPGSADLGPFYSSEGLALINASDKTGTQQYTLQLKLTDHKSGTEEVSLSRVLPNLEALFRNTHVIVNVGFSEGYMHIYGEIAPWSENDVYGKATEEK